MRIFRHYADLPADARGGVVALGNFDGMHLGHRAVIGEALRIARELRVPCGVMTFEPHPRAFFAPNQPPFRLTPFRAKARLIEAMGVDNLFQQAFTTEFSSLSAEAFVEEVLVRALAARHVVVGYDYVFGKGRQGNPELLGELAVQRGFGVSKVGAVEVDGAPYSSTRIRDHLRKGEPEAAALLMGRYWEIEGRVETGDQRGRTIGFPTANVALDEYLHPEAGVYAIRAGVDRGEQTIWHDGVANFGRRPTFDKTDELLEVHLFDTDQDLYNQHLRVALIGFLRPERKFSGLDELRAQIARDAAEARALLARHEFPAGPAPVVPAQNRRPGVDVTTF